MLLTEPKDRKFFDWLITTGVFTRSQFNSWSKPDEGQLFPVLLSNSHLINDEAYIKSGLAFSPKNLHLPTLQLDVTFVRKFPKPLLISLVRQFNVLPLAQHGQTQWFALPYFFNFNLAEFCDVLNIDPKTPAFSIITPSHYQEYSNQLIAQAPEYDA